MTKRFGRVTGAAIGAVVLVTSWAGCTADKTTEVVPGAMTQIQIPKNLRFVRIDVQAQGQPSQCTVAPVDPGNPGFVTLPSTLGMLPGGDASRPVTITLTGYRDDGSTSPDPSQNINDCLVSPFQPKANGYTADVKILRRARVTYANGHIVFLPMPLRYPCWETATPCKTDETCVAGTCQSTAATDGAKLVDFREDMVDGRSQVCFSAYQCMADQVSATPVDANGCIYQFPKTPPGQGLNVRVYYDGGEQEILDVDPAEGYLVPDSTKPQQFQLAPGLCQLSKNALMLDPKLSMRKIIAVTAASICPPKTVLQPLCAGCNVAHELRPLPSALYVLMDKSLSNGNNFGPGTLSAVLSLSLNDPIIRSTYVAFGLMPDTANMNDRCNSASYTSPGVAFDLAPVVQAPVAQLLAGVMPTQNANLDLDGALQQGGAYQVLRNLPTLLDGANAGTPNGTKFNRRALMLLFNRAAMNGCGMNESALAAAALASPDHLYTYVVMLPPNPNYPSPQMPMGPQDQTEAKAIAAAGGTQFIDATNPNDQTTGALALEQVVADLGSCEYDLPAGIDTTWTVSYTAGSGPVTVPHSSDCSASNDNVDGWAIDPDNSRLRICGQSCQTIRTNLAQASIVASATMQPVPYLPVFAVQPCK